MESEAREGGKYKGVCYWAGHYCVDSRLNWLLGLIGRHQRGQISSSCTSETIQGERTSGRLGRKREREIHLFVPTCLLPLVQSIPGGITSPVLLGCVTSSLQAELVPVGLCVWWEREAAPVTLSVTLGNCVKAGIGVGGGHKQCKVGVVRRIWDYAWTKSGTGVSRK